MSTIVGLASRTMLWLIDDIDTLLYYWPSFESIMLATTLLLCPENEGQRSVNDCWPCIMEDATAVRRH